MMVDGPLLTVQPKLLNRQFAAMAASGVQRVRVEFNWSNAQPYRAWKWVPLAYAHYFSGPRNKVPTYFLATDELVGLAAEHHLSVLPVVLNAPSWDAYPAGKHFEPANDAPYGAYLSALVHRYGPHGSFWSHRFWVTHHRVPRTPITEWQVWDEPNLPYFWDNPDWAPSYVNLLRAAHSAIRRADPHAKIVLASLTGASYRALPLIYAIHHARRLFDAVAANTYEPTPQNVISTLGADRRVMDGYGDSSKPLIDSECGWPSALGKTVENLGVATTERGQAQKLSQLLPLLAANRKTLNLQSFFYDTWMSTDQRGALSPFEFAGLYRYELANQHVYAKPAAAAFKAAAFRMEGRG
jgi:hypothetical protein